MAEQQLSKLIHRKAPAEAPPVADPEEPTERPTNVPAEAARTSTAKKPASRKHPSQTTKRTAGGGEDRETASKGVPVHLPASLNDRLQVYMAKTRKSHQTVLLDAVSATYKRLPDLIREATAGGEETDEDWTDLFNRQKRPAPVADPGERIKHTVRVTPSSRATLDRITVELDAPSRNFVIITAYDAFLPPLNES